MEINKTKGRTLETELDGVIEVARGDYDMKVGTGGKSVALLYQIAMRAWDIPLDRGRERLAPREMFTSQTLLAYKLDCAEKTVGNNCLALESAGLRVRRKGRKAKPGQVMIYRLPTVEEFAVSLGFEGDQVTLFAQEVAAYVAQRRGYGRAAA